MIRLLSGTRDGGFLMTGAGLLLQASRHFLLMWGYQLENE